MINLAAELRQTAFWFRQTANVASWWLALQALVDLIGRTWSPDPVTVGVVAKPIVFGLAAALITWKWPPRIEGVPVAWWIRFTVVLGLWFLVLDRIWGIIATTWRHGAVGFTSIGNTIVFGIVAAVVTWFVAPRPLAGD